MLIDLNIPEVPEAHFWDGEGTVYLRRYVDEAGNKIMYVRVPAGSSIGEHTHTSNMEICYILSGSAHVRYDGEVLPLTPGTVHYCPKGHRHTVYNDSTEDMVMYCVVAAQP